MRKLVLLSYIFARNDHMMVQCLRIPPLNMKQRECFAVSNIAVLELKINHGMKGLRYDGRDQLDRIVLQLLLASSAADSICSSGFSLKTGISTRPRTSFSKSLSKTCSEIAGFPV